MHLLLQLHPQYAQVIARVGAGIDGAGDLLRVGAGGGGEARGQRIVRKKCVAEVCEAGGGGGLVFGVDIGGRLRYLEA